MIELQRHIEILLLENECVIVPDFGGFMTHGVPARYDESDRTFLPPLRTLGFNPHLRMNDSVLAQSYVEAYDISYPEAIRKIEDEVAELKHTLGEQGSYQMGSLGTLTVNEEGNYEFEPCEAGILSPELYGLGGFSFRRLTDRQGDEETVAQQHDRRKRIVRPQRMEQTPTLLDITDTEESDSQTIHIKMSWIRNAVAVAAAVVGFFLIATPITNSDLRNQSMTNLQGNLLYKLIPQDTNDVPAAKPAEVVEPQPVVAEKPAPKAGKPAEVAEPQPVVAEKPAQPAPVQQVRKADTYCVVLASQVRRIFAEDFVEKLHQQGYATAEIQVHNKVLRVVLGEYATEEEARQHLSEIHSKPEFREAWVFRKKAEI